MRRLIASLVLCVIAWGPLSPLAIATAGEPIPACCRRGGKHHCMMMEMAGRGATDDGSPHASKKPDPCPYRGLKAIPTATAEIHTSAALVQFVAKAGRVAPPAFEAFDFRQVATIPQRGPPQSLLSAS